MKSDTILDSRLFITHDLDIPLKANIFFQLDKANKEHLINQLFLYDKIVIPTKDFGIIPILIDWIGINIFEDALAQKTLLFLHLNSMIGYGGNGVGIHPFNIKPSDNKYKWWQEAVFGDIEKSVELQCKFKVGYLDRKHRTKIVKDVIENSTDVNNSEEFFDKNIRRETYADIKNDTVYTSFITSYYQNKYKEIRLNNLPDIQPNQINLINSARQINNPTDLILLIAWLNLEISISKIFQDTDIYTSTGSEIILRNKLKRIGFGKDLYENFISLLELNDLPDIGKGFSNDVIDFKKIWRIRNKRHAKKFRKWLRCVDKENVNDLKEYYVKSLFKKSVINTFPLKTVRFALVSAIGLLNPMAGMVVSGVDNFFVEKWLKGYNPKLFFDELSSLKIESNKKIGI